MISSSWLLLGCDSKEEKSDKNAIIPPDSSPSNFNVMQVLSLKKRSLQVYRSGKKILPAQITYWINASKKVQESVKGQCTDLKDLWSESQVSFFPFVDLFKVSSHSASPLGNTSSRSINAREKKGGMEEEERKNNKVSRIPLFLEENGGRARGSFSD